MRARTARAVISTTARAARNAGVDGGPNQSRLIRAVGADVWAGAILDSVAVSACRERSRPGFLRGPPRTVTDNRGRSSTT